MLQGVYLSSVPAATVSQLTLMRRYKLVVRNDLQLLLLGLPVAPDLDAALPFAGTSTGVRCICLHLPAYQRLLQGEYIW